MCEATGEMKKLLCGTQSAQGLLRIRLEYPDVFMEFLQNNRFWIIVAVASSKCTLRGWFVEVTAVTEASFTSTGHQEQMALVTGGYTPDVIVVERGNPVRLNIVRQESATCSEMILLPAFGENPKLPEGETVSVEFMPKIPANTDFPVRWKCFEAR